MSGTPDCGGDAAAYALGALEPQEEEAFRAHLQECAICRDEVQALSSVVQALPMAVPQYQAPRELRQRVLRDVQDERAMAERAQSPPGARRGAWRGRRAAWRGRELIAGATATVVAAAAVVTGIELSAGVAATVIQAQVTGIAGSAQLRVAGGRAELVVRHLTPPGHGHVYEVWLQSGKAAPVPASVLFGVTASGDADVGIPDRIRGVSVVMVTQEPLGGTAKPTRSPVIVARLD